MADMPGWVQIGTAFGVPMLILAGIAWFVATRVWPVVVEQIKFNQQQQQQFLTSLKDINTALSGQNDLMRSQIDTLRTHTETIRGLQRVIEAMRRPGGAAGGRADK